MSKRKHPLDFPGSQAAIDFEGDICDIVGIDDGAALGAYPHDDFGDGPLLARLTRDSFAPIGPVARALLRVRK